MHTNTCTAPSVVDIKDDIKSDSMATIRDLSEDIVRREMSAIESIEDTKTEYCTGTATKEDADDRSKIKDMRESVREKDSGGDKIASEISNERQVASNTFPARLPDCQVNSANPKTSKSKEVGEENLGQDHQPCHQKSLDCGWGWFVVLGVFIVNFILGGYNRSFGFVLISLQVG